MDEDNIAAERRRAEAAQWFARLKSLPVSHGTLKDFFAWRREGGNAEAFEEAERFWSEAEKVGERPSILRAVEEAGRRRARRRFFPATHPLALATVAFVVILGAAWGAYQFFPGGQRFDTAAGEQRVIALEDGSRLNLNTETAISVRYSPSARHLVLKSGEAVFSVAKDKARPFIVAADGVVVTATGTKFDVTLRDKRTVVTLIEGRVSVRAPNGSLIWLSPGEQWRWPPGGRQVQTVKTENVTAWTQGRVVFDNTALANAIAEINRYGGKPVILDAPRFGAQRLSGSFQTGDAESFAAAVTAFLPLRQWTDADGRIHLAPARPSKKNSGDLG
jgi:transmembrane sensor